MSGALELAFGIPMWLGYVISAIVVIPLVTYGVRMISRFQIVTQPFWIALNILPFIFIATVDWEKFDLWLTFSGLQAGFNSEGNAPFVLAQFGTASAVILALMAQIGEQVDFLRFLPPENQRKWRHKIAVFLAGPGWVVLGAPKLLAGSFLVVLTLSAGVPADKAADPAHMYLTAFGYMIPSHTAALLLTVAFVVVSQLKINVMNAYAGSLAWSNFFSRLTHSHPGRVVWLVFNVSIGLLLMQLGVYKVLEQTLGIFSIIAVAWLCTISADLFINKHFGLSPPGIEFKRAHLYDINPVGTGTMAIASLVALIAHFGAFGAMASSLAPYLALVLAFTVSPLIAWKTGGKYYLARKPRQTWQNRATITCSVCAHDFEPEDMAWCPAYAAPICSLCCSLDSRCHNLCKPKAHLKAQTAQIAQSLLPSTVIEKLSTRLGRYMITVAVFISLLGAILAIVAYHAGSASPETALVVNRTILIVFFAFALIAGIACWFYVLAHDSRIVAEEESSRQTTLLLKEIAAHKKTDAALQKAKDNAEAANLAKSRYVVGLSHELRTPLNAVLGYAQILERDETIPPTRQPSIKLIRRSADHLSGLIDGLLDISRIETGHLQVYSNEINLHDFLDQIIDMLKPQAEAKGITFSDHRAETLPNYVRTDEKRLRQILVNLLSNAIKFTEKGEVALDVSYRNQVATFRISDTGRGISQKDLERVFEPFQRGENEHIRHLPGLGLGLTITKLLTNTLGGELSVTSDYGKGSTFQVRLMLAPIDRPKSLTAPTRRIETYSGPRRTLIVVDDNDDHCALMREILVPLDFIVLTAKSGLECLTLIEGIRPDLYFIDIRMPEMSGWELVARLRERGESAPIIMLSANIGDVTRPATLAENAHNDTLSKPFDIRRLHDKLALHLGLEWVYATPESSPQRAPSAPLESPPLSDLQDLIRLGEIGYIKGIEAKLTILAENEKLHPFIEKARDYIRAFNMADYDAFLRNLEQKMDEQT